MTETTDSQARPAESQTYAASLKEAAGRRQRSRNMRPLTRLIPFMMAHKGDALAAFFFLLISTSASLGLSFAGRTVIGAISSGSRVALDQAFLGLGVVAVVLAAATALRYYFVTKLGERTVADVRAVVYRHILTLDQDYFLKTRTGEVLSRLTVDMTIVENMLATSISVALRNILMFFGAIGVLLAVSPRLTGYFAILAPFVIAPIFIFGRTVRKRTVETQDRFAAAMGYAGESLDALDTVQAFGREAASSNRFTDAVNLAFNTSLIRMRARAIMTALVIVLMFGGVALILWAGARFVVSGGMGGDQLFQFVFLSVMAASSVGALGEVWGELQKASGAMSRIGEILDAHPMIAPPANPTPLPVPARGEIAFENVTFAYPTRDEAPALRGFSLHVRPGETVALVGPSGAGKSTVLRLLLRFYDPQSGRISIDGVNLTEADPREVRARCALVAQDASLFSGPAIDNIRFGREDATEAEIRAAASDAEAEGFLNALPEGFSTHIG
ncbi:MAG: ABC transporter transmembrane domain-containing protein, partial [Alphaproteobacteria bacterium]